MNILVTGGAGFIGSNFIHYFLNANPNDQIINFDLLTYAGNLENLKGVENYDNYHFIKGNICDVSLVEGVFTKYKVDNVIHFAAESHVDKSIENPENFIKSNIEGTFVLLETAKKFWMKSVNQPKEGYENSRFHHISTDEVYGSLGSEGFFTEKTPYAPNSPYSASKASSDFLVRSYNHTYGLNVVTSNCSNNYGPHQHDEKLIPTIIRKALKGEDIPIYGDGTNVRDWLYVEDHCIGISTIFKHGKTGETYLLGGNSEQTNIEIVNQICQILDRLLPKKQGSYLDQLAFVTDRAGHDFRYAIDFSKVSEELGWNPMQNINTGMEKTVGWYINKYN
ncbi:dTDP-glucose 4,6-dehydratase [Arenibacter palladensis]|uniref:dTDP-glucose 4,6-dehydratase n=1 Tax=Arenibacter palladensis TaxID=237373 RepID=UPI002FD6F7FC